MNKLALIICALLISSLTQANTPHSASVLGKVTLDIDSDVQQYKTNDKISLQDGSRICFISGKGEISIDQGAAQLSKVNQCAYLQASQKKTWWAYIKNKVVIFSPQGVGSKGGVRGGGSKTKNKQAQAYILPIYLQAGKDLAIQNKQWASKQPITLQLLNPNLKPVHKLTSKTTMMTSFILPAHFLTNKDGYYIKVTDKTGAVLMNSTLHITASAIPASIAKQQTPVKKQPKKEAVEFEFPFE